MLRGSGAAREFWPVFRVAYFPAEPRDPRAEFVAPFPILFEPCVLALFCQLCELMRNGYVGISFKIQNGIDPFPPVQPCTCRSRVDFVLIHRAIGFTNGFE